MATRIATEHLSAPRRGQSRKQGVRGIALILEPNMGQTYLFETAAKLQISLRVFDKQKHTLRHTRTRAHTHRSSNGDVGRGAEAALKVQLVLADLTALVTGPDAPATFPHEDFTPPLSLRLLAFFQVGLNTPVLSSRVAVGETQCSMRTCSEKELPMA